ncbi:MAG: cyclase [Acidobacteria bacterium]|nr:cyclase [Acidobacteriota bacterium]
MDRLKEEARGLIGALGDRAVASVRDKVEGAAGRLTDYVDDGGGPGLMAAVTGAKSMAEGKGPVRSMLGAGMKALTEKFRGKGGGKGKNLKVTNIVESIDVGVPIRLAYNQWTQFADFPSFMKKVESVEQAGEDQKLNWKAQVLWSHRTWEATIQEQSPDDKIVWRSKGAKGHVDGAVTFHELAPNLTRVLLVLQYHPQGLFEHTGNIWRAQGRRARLELKHYRRHVMAEAMLHPDEIEGWRGVIEDGEVTKDHETAVQEERGAAQGDRADGRRGQPREEADEERPEDQYEYEGAEDRDEEDEKYEEAEDGGKAGGDRAHDGRPRRGTETGRGAGDGRWRAEGAPRRGHAPQRLGRRKRSAAAQRGGGL